MVTFTRIGEVSVVQTDDLQRQAVIVLTEGGTSLHLSRITLKYNGGQPTKTKNWELVNLDTN